VQQFLRGRLANFKVPKDIQFLDALPREAAVRSSSANCAIPIGKAAFAPVHDRPKNERCFKQDSCCKTVIGRSKDRSWKKLPGSTQ
jgi:hypothetical protein